MSKRGELALKSDDRWKTVVRYDGYRGLEIGDSRGQHQGGDWRRQQKDVIRSQSDWE